MAKLRLIILSVLLIAALAIGVWIGSILNRIFPATPAPKQIYNTVAILKQVQTLSQLITVKFVIEKVVILEDMKWYGESRVLMVAHGVVKAGVDLSKIKPEDVRATDNRIVITLPQATVTDVYLDEQKTQIIERSTGLLRGFDKDLEQTARRQAIDDLRRAARQHGILTEAADRARAQMGNLFRQMGFSEVEVVLP